MDLETLALVTQIACYVALPTLIGWGILKVSADNEKANAPDAKAEARGDKDDPRRDAAERRAAEMHRVQVEAWKARTALDQAYLAVQQKKLDGGFE